MWGTGNKAKQLPPQNMTQQQEIKRQQITSLFTYNTSIRELTRDTQYEIPIQVTPPSEYPDTPSTIYLLVNLPSTFPEDPPVITLSPQGLQHPWLERDVLVGHEKLKNWGVHASLGKLVKECREEFEKHCPVRVKSGGDNTWSTKPPPPIPTASTSTPQTQLHLPNGRAYSSNMHVNGATYDFPQLGTLSQETLIDLLESPYAFNTFFDNLDQVRNTKVVREELRAGNEQLANKNLSKEPELKELQNNVTTLYEKHQDLRHTFDEKFREQTEVFKRFSPQHHLRQLRAAIFESEELSEQIASSFLEPSSSDTAQSSDVFIKQFRELRKVYHLRQAKWERVENGGVEGLG